MIWLLLAPLISRVVKVVATLAVSLVIVILMGAPMLGLLLQPMAPWWFGRGSGVFTVGGAPALPTAGTAPSAGGTAVPVPTLAPLESSAIVDAVLAAAEKWLGVPYLWGGCSRIPGIDCSCLVRTAWQAVGVQLPRITTDQIRAVHAVSNADARPGDLVFFDDTCLDCGANPTHVGLVEHQPGTMIDAGDPVKIERIFTGHNARFGRVR